MTEQEQQIAIAEACGWKWFLCENTELPDYGEGYWYRKGDSESQSDIPDYLHDLNAMHEAEKMLGDALYNGKWLENLHFIVNRDKGLSCNITYAYRATAAQRAEAFLRTIGKWKD